MASPKAKQFIETALFASGPYALSYSDPKQKWLIQRHLLSLLQDFPSFTPSTAHFMHNDGAQVNLLRAAGLLRVSSAAPPVPLVVWLHQNYPLNPPLVFVSLHPTTPVHRHHPFVDTSGAVSPPYILTWKYPPCNVTDLVRNLVQLFKHDHPFSYSPETSPLPSPSPPQSATSFSHPCSVSRKEALDRLVGMLHYDIVALHESTFKDIEELSQLQEELKRRERLTTRMVKGLEEERRELRRRANCWAEESDRLVNWLRVNDRRQMLTMAEAASDVDEIEEVFEIDEESRAKLDSSAADLAIEDVLYQLDKAVEFEAVSFDSYIKQVRSLARKQFFHRAMRMKLDGLLLLDISQ